MHVCMTHFSLLSVAQFLSLGKRHRHFPELLNFRELKFSVSFCILAERGRKGSGGIAVPAALHKDGCLDLCVHRGVLLPAANLSAGGEAQGDGVLGMQHSCICGKEVGHPLPLQQGNLNLGKAK